MLMCRACLIVEPNMMPMDDAFLKDFNLLTGLNVTFQEKTLYSCLSCYSAVNFFIEFRQKCIEADCSFQKCVADLKEISGLDCQDEEESFVKKESKFQLCHSQEFEANDAAHAEDDIPHPTENTGNEVLNMEENTEEDNEFSTLQNVEMNPKVTTRADLKKKRDLLLEQKKLIMKQKKAIVTNMHSDLNSGQNIDNTRTSDGDLDATSSAVFFASCDTIAFDIDIDINKVERLSDDDDDYNDFIESGYYTTTTSEENLLPTASENAGFSNFESIPDLTSESLLSGSNYKNTEITNVTPIGKVVDDQLNPESELELTPLASTTSEDNSALPQRDEPVLNTGLSCTFDNINDSFPERELEPECSRESRKRQQKADAKDIRTKNKILRMDGKEYTGFRDTGNKKYIQDSIKPARKLGETCGSVKCLRSQVVHCEKFTESERQNIFEYFWKLSWQEKKMFVYSMIDSKETTRKTKSRQKSGQVSIKEYYLNLNEKRERVCQKTFLRTLGIKEWTVRYWMSKKPAVGRVNEERQISR